jgi:hypothetical protein
VISGFCREVDENSAPLGCYVASVGNLLLKFWSNLSIPSLLALEEGTDKLSRNVGKGITTTLCVIVQRIAAVLVG